MQNVCILIRRGGGGRKLSRVAKELTYFPGFSRFSGRFAEPLIRKSEK